MKFFSLDFLNLMSCKNRNGVMVVKLFFKICSPFSKIGLNGLFKTPQTYFFDGFRS